MYKLKRRANQKGQKGNYYVEFHINGQRIRQSTGTQDRKLAIEFAKKFYEDTYRAVELNSKAHYKWQDGVMLYLRDKGHIKSLDDIKRHLRELDRWLHDVRLIDIDFDLIEKIKHERSQENKRVRCKVKGKWSTKEIDCKVTNASVNRMLEILRAVLRVAHEHNIIESLPAVKMLHEERERIRWLTQLEVDALSAFLQPHLLAMVKFTLLTGLREANITKLQWSQVDFRRKILWISSENMKNGTGLSIPLNMDSLSLILSQRGSHKNYVFTYKGKPIRKANCRAWREALKKAGIEDFRWHDLRHTWASWHVQNGTPLEVLMKLGGWSSLDMVMKYAHLGESHIAAHAENICKITASNPSQSEATP